MNNARDTNYFTKILQTTNVVSDIGKWKSDINGGLRWKIIKGWPHQHFIVSAFNITLYKIIHGKNYEKLYKLLFKAKWKLIP